MDSMILMALVATLGTWCLTALGAATVVFFKSPSQKLLNLLVGFASGVMIAAAFWSLLLPAIELAEVSSVLPPALVVTGGVLFGAAFLLASDRLLRAVRQRSDAGMPRSAMLILSITLHNIPEGLAIGVAFGALGGGVLSLEGLMGAISLAVGIGLQNFPEGAAVSLPLRREGFSRRRSFFYGQASGLVEPIAGVLGAMLVVYVEAMLPYALSFAAGAMILVAVHELIPECQEGRAESPYAATVGILLGFALMTFLDVLLG